MLNSQAMARESTRPPLPNDIEPELLQRSPTHEQVAELLARAARMWTERD
jgi:hypothetical protein